ncbi:hypothetical protein KKI23_04370, partial [Patescibacteria group bacterium]|nr:hypothetical protein [Patescibacteria group bacterium]
MPTKKPKSPTKKVGRKPKPKAKSPRPKVKLPAAKLQVQPKTKTGIRLNEFIGGFVIFSVGAAAVYLGVGLLTTDNIEVVTTFPVILGEADQQSVTEVTTQLESEPVKPCCGDESVSEEVVEEENIAEVIEESKPADLSEKETEEVLEIVESEPVAEATVPEIVETNFNQVVLEPSLCSNYQFYQVTSSQQDLSNSSIILRELGKSTTLTVVADLSELLPADWYYHLLWNKADDDNCRYLLFTRSAKEPQAQKKGLWYFDLRSGELKELTISGSFIGYGNFRFSQDNSRLLLIHDNIAGDDAKKTMELLTISEEKAEILMTLS